MIVVGSIALAASEPGPETSAESTHDRWTSMKDLSVEPSLVRRLERPVELSLGPETLTLADGWLTPVFSGRLGGAWEDEARRWFARQQEGEVPRLPSEDERAGHALVGWVWSGGVGPARRLADAP